MPIEAPPVPDEVAPVPSEPPPAPGPSRSHPTLATGRRKESVARVRLFAGTGRFELNGRPMEDYFPSRAHRMVITEPLRLIGREKDFDVIAQHAPLQVIGS